MQTALVKNTELPLAQRFSIASNSILQLSIVEMWLGGVNGLLYMFGDGIVVWRAWAVWTERQVVIIIPGFFLLATFAIFITSSTLRTIASVNPSIIEPNSLFGSLVIAGYTASIATNFSSTVLIGIKACKHRRFMKTLGMGPSKAAKVLILLTESGVVYIVLQVINVCIAFLDDQSSSNSPLNIASHVWGVIMNFVAVRTFTIHITLLTLCLLHDVSLSGLISNTYYLDHPS
ncbi:hypothetical protein GYMLUDRAFT_952440 [Collybiopsis luxurians FD-317 M1]|nr:hypothetical protein GYMLUDRAFT_952440 [Collybiopsis luxurians FD-317 M1]